MLSSVALSLLLLQLGSSYTSVAAAHVDSLHRAGAARERLNGGSLPGPLRTFIARVPKAELHIHVEGTLEPEMMLEIAARNGLPPPYPSVEAARAAYDFANLQSFLDLYYFGCSVLRTRADFYDLAMAYFRRAAASHVVHAEVFFDPQTHLGNGLDWEVFMEGLLDAAHDAAAQLRISVSYIMCFRKDLTEESANKVLSGARPWLRQIVAVGLDSTELGNPPSKFVRVYDRAASLGLLRVAHAGEEGGPEVVWQTLELLHVLRIDHGVHSLDDPELMSYLNATRTPLTVCPLSNLKLKVYEGQVEEKLTELVRSGLVVTINSDDAAYFSGYVNDNYEYVAAVAELDIYQVARLAANSFEASFSLPGGEQRRQELRAVIDQMAGEAAAELRAAAAGGVVA